MYDFKRIDPTDDDWKAIEATYDGTVYKTKAWFDYLAYQHCLPFIAKVFQDSNLIGYFVGALLKRGVWTLGAPLEGVGTGNQGLAMLRETLPPERIEIYKALAKWVFKNRYAVWLQVEDWQLEIYDFEGNEDIMEYHDSSWVDLTADEETMWRRTSQKSCRYMINKAKKQGVFVREAEDEESFLNVHFEQHLDVMERKGLSPLRSKENLRELIKATYPDKLLLLEAVTSDGKIVGTGMYPVGGGSSCLFMVAAKQEDLVYCPNEILMWEALVRCKARGARFFNMNGVMPYKLKYGTLRDFRPRLVFQKHNGLAVFRKFFKDIYHKLRFSLFKIKEES
ncbi:MAG: GNAT family N-acetyltransferase [Bacteroidales bacterium]|nr:GNAT family N-acetyltransferase [Bacteroidales bacterium]